VTRCSCGNKAETGETEGRPCSKAKELNAQRKGRIFRNETIRANREKTDGIKTKVRKQRFRVTPSDQIHISKSYKRGS
jgi:hypothetical protein